MCRQHKPLQEYFTIGIGQFTKMSVPKSKLFDVL